MLYHKKVFCSRFREIRKKSGDTQSDVAALLGVSDSQISEIENGNKTTSVERLSIICEHYHVSADYLLGLTDDPTPHLRKSSTLP